MHTEIATTKIIKTVLDNVSETSKEELSLLAGANFKNKVYKEIVQNDLNNIIAVFDSDNIPVALTGIINYKDDVYSLFFISTKKFDKLPKLSFLKKSKEQLNLWSNKFQKIIDTVYEKNTSVIKWVEWLGFQKLGKSIDGFIIYEL